jgi:hypothetical protein
MGEMKAKRTREAKPASASSITESVVQYLTSREKQRNEELILEKRKLDMQEKEFELQKSELEKRSKREDEEREERKFLMKMLIEKSNK